MLRQNGIFFQKDHEDLNIIWKSLKNDYKTDFAVNYFFSARLINYLKLKIFKTIVIKSILIKIIVFCMVNS